MPDEDITYDDGAERSAAIEREYNTANLKRTNEIRRYQQQQAKAMTDRTKTPEKTAPEVPGLNKGVEVVHSAVDAAAQTFLIFPTIILQIIIFFGRLFVGNVTKEKPELSYKSWTNGFLHTTSLIISIIIILIIVAIISMVITFIANYADWCKVPGISSIINYSWNNICLTVKDAAN